MSFPHERHIRLDGAFNVRDLGGYAAAGGGVTRWRSFLRADALHELSAADVRTLLGIGVRTIIDLRSDREVAHQPSVFAGHEGVQYHQIALFDELAPVDAFVTEKGRFDLSARYQDAVDQCRPALGRVAATIAGARQGAILFNCTAGKDRTGIVAAMLLSLAGVASDEIAADYALTASIAEALMDRLRRRAMARGLDEATSSMLLSSEAATMLTLLRHVDERYGGFRSYLTEWGEEEGVRLIAARILMAGHVSPGPAAGEVIPPG